MLTSALGSRDWLEPGLSEFMVHLTAPTTVTIGINSPYRSIQSTGQDQRCMQNYSCWPHESAWLMGNFLRLQVSWEKPARLILGIDTLLSCWMNATSAAQSLDNGSFRTRSVRNSARSGSLMVSPPVLRFSEPLALINIPCRSNPCY